jgi:hypothetical protein
MKRNKIERDPEKHRKGEGEKVGKYTQKEGGEEKAQQQIRHFVNFIGLKGS